MLQLASKQGKKGKKKRWQSGRNGLLSLFPMSNVNISSETRFELVGIYELGEGGEEKRERGRQKLASVLERKGFKSVEKERL